MMTVLAFDTATEAVVIGLGLWPDSAETGAPKLIADLDLVAPRAANEKLLPAVQALLAAHGLVAGDLDCIVVGRGPGSFTGVRIAVATAKGLAQGLGVPLLGAGTLDAVAWRFASRDGLVGVVGDAMRREVYPALFRCGGGRVERLGPDGVETPAEVAARWASQVEEPVLLAGNGLAKYSDVFLARLGDRGSIAPDWQWLPSGAGLLADAYSASGGRPEGDPGSLLPVYTRLADAEEAEARKLGREPGLPEHGVAGPEV